MKSIDDIAAAQKAIHHRLRAIVPIDRARQERICGSRPAAIDPAGGPPARPVGTRNHRVRSADKVGRAIEVTTAEICKGIEHATSRNTARTATETNRAACRLTTESTQEIPQPARAKGPSAEESA